MRTSNRRSSLLLGATAPMLFLAGCAASPAIERADDARSSARRNSAPTAESAPFAQPPSEDGALAAAPKGEAEMQQGPSRSAEPPRAGNSGAEYSGKSTYDEAAPAARAPSAADSDYRAENRARGAGSAYKSAPSPIAPKKDVRPGLGTTWGETRTSHVSQVSFERQSSNNPSAVFQINYNDDQGILAQTGERSLNNFEPNYTESSGRFVSVEIVDPGGSPLLGLSRSDRTYVVGRDGDRYAIRIRNHDRQRFEVVASVDGLDVIDGSKAGFGKRGYILEPYGTLLIEGFRRSSSAIASFRFGSVADSYAGRTGSDRHVGVIGVAMFGERYNEPVYTDGEIDRRETADPFPGQYARPPHPRRGYDLQ